jgi:hypothetical protein
MLCCALQRVLCCAVSCLLVQTLMELPLLGVPGGVRWIDTRTQWFDDNVSAAIADGIKQVGCQRARRCLASAQQHLGQAVVHVQLSWPYCRAWLIRAPCHSAWRRT